MLLKPARSAGYGLRVRQPVIAAEGEGRAIALSGRRERCSQHMDCGNSFWCCFIFTQESGALFSPTRCQSRCQTFSQSGTGSVRFHHKTLGLGQKKWFRHGITEKLVIELGTVISAKNGMGSYVQIFRIPRKFNSQLINFDLIGGTSSETASQLIDDIMLHYFSFYAK